MNLSDLATKLAEKENLTQKEADAVVKLIFRLFTDAPSAPFSLFL
jgi:nucleoid DNA-binding protein